MNKNTLGIGKKKKDNNTNSKQGKENSQIEAHEFNKLGREMEIQRNEQREPRKEIEKGNEKRLKKKNPVEYIQNREYTEETKLKEKKKVSQKSSIEKWV